MEGERERERWGKETQDQRTKENKLIKGMSVMERV
jgi:hypothetical protein